MIATINKQKDSYGLKMLLVILLLLFVSLAMFYKLQQNNPIPLSAVIPSAHGKKIHILRSYSTAKVYQKNSIDKSDYLMKLDKFKKYITPFGYDVKYIDVDEINTLGKGCLLFIFDAVALSESTKDSIKNLLSIGGNIFFNFTAGFSDGNGKYIGSNFVKEITGLQLRPDKNFINFKEGLSIVQRILSPLKNTNSGISLEAPIYDLIPIFINSKELKPDLVMINYDQTNPPIAREKNMSLKIDEAGVAWHGYYGKGKWFYMNLPSYIFYESKKNYYDYAQVFNAIVDYLSSDLVISKFPYIDKESVVFVSEDTEYKFENFQKFSDMAKKYKIPVTAFIVTSLAEHEDNKEMVKNIAKNPYVEFASHSHLHKKIIDTNETYIKQETSDTKTILDKISKQPIKGFRPPREELNDTMKKHLADSGFSYILGKSEEFLYPRYDELQKDLLIIPRHGTDDYSYLINLDWDRKQIIEQIIKESEFVTSMDAIYTLSVHTHLFTYSSNIKILEGYFEYLKAHPNVSVLDGLSIAKRVKRNKNIHISYSKTGNTVVLNIENKNKEVVENFHCKIFKNPDVKIKSIKCDQTQGGKNSANKSEVNINLKHLKPSSITTVYIELS